MMLAGQRSLASTNLCTEAPSLTAKTLGWRLHLHPWISRLRHKVPQVLGSVCQGRPPPRCFYNRIIHDDECPNAMLAAGDRQAPTHEM